MVRRRYTLAHQYGQRLSNELVRIGLWTRRNRNDPNVKKKAMMKADKALTKFCSLLIPYVYRTRVKRDIGRNAEDLTDAQKQKICMDQKKVQLKAFSDVIDDVLRS